MKEMQTLITHTIFAEITNLPGNHDNNIEGNSQAHPNTSSQDGTTGIQLNVDDMMRRISQVEEQVKGETQAYDDIETFLSQPFSEEILAIRALDSFKMPTIEAYDGLSDPTDHLCRYIV